MEPKKTYEQKLEEARAWLRDRTPSHPPVIGLYCITQLRIPACHPGGPLKAWEVTHGRR